MYSEIERNVGGIEGLYVITPQVYVDDRGYFFESYNDNNLLQNDIISNNYFIQDNESYSEATTLRGLHYQKRHPQTKIVRVIQGAVFDVALDLRPHSKTYGHAYALLLDSVNHKQLYIPRGFAHGFLALVDTIFAYKCDNYYYPDDQHGINPFDKNIIWHTQNGEQHQGIKWPVYEDYIMADRDRNWPNLADLQK